MTSSRKKDFALEDLEQLKQLAELSKDEKLQKIVQLERKLKAAQSTERDLSDKLRVSMIDADLAEQTVQRFIATQDKVTAKKLRRTKMRGGGKATAIICLNDWHCEENVDPEVTQGLNEFNLGIAKKRLTRTLNRALHLLDFTRSLSNIRELVVWWGGDHINGYIHEENLENNFIGPTEAILWMQNELATSLRSMLEHAEVDKITVITSYGNHGRTTRKRRISTGYKTSWEWLAYNNVAAQFAGEKRVEFHIGKGYHSFLDIQGHLVRFHHGDAVRFMGGVGGVHIPLRKKIAQWNKTGRMARLDILGHFHQYSDDWYYVLSGCLVGYNAYAIEIAAEFQRPSQTFIVMDRAEAKVMCLPIFCEDVVKLGEV